MKLVVVAFSFIIFIFRAYSLEIDPTDDRTIEYFLAQFFEGEDPSISESIETEVKKHSSELLSGFLSLVGDSFDFDASDMKTQLKNLAQDFDVENLIKVVEDIFGIGSVVVSQLQKNSGAVKDKIAAFIDSVVSEFVSTRRKRANEDRPEIFHEIDCNPKLENDSEENKWRDVPEIQQDKSDKKEDRRVLNDGPPVKQNEHKVKRTDYITPGVKFSKDVDADFNAKPSPNGVPETELPHSKIPSKVVQKGDVLNDGPLVKQNKHKTKRTDYITPGVKFRKDADGNDNVIPSANGAPETELPLSKIPSRVIQKGDNEKFHHDTTTQKRELNMGLLDPVITDRKKRKDDGEVTTRDIPIEDGTFVKGQLDSVDSDTKNQENDGEKSSHDQPIQDGTFVKGQLDSVTSDTKKQEDGGEKPSHDIPTQDGTFVKGQLDSVKPDTQNQEENEENNEIEMDENDKYKEKKSEVRENFRKLVDLSHELIGDMVDITEDRKEQWKKNALKAKEAIKEYIEESKDLTLDIFQIYGNFLYDIFDQETEKIRTIFKH